MPGKVNPTQCEALTMVTKAIGGYLTRYLFWFCLPLGMRSGTGKPCSDFRGRIEWTLRVECFQTRNYSQRGKYCIS